jgi:putative phosphoesterase
VPVAALYDVHGNLPALEAVLEEVAALGVELVVSGGDVVAGPFPRATLDALSALDDRVRFVRGNADRDPGEWAAAQLRPEQLEFLAALPETISLDVDGLGRVLFCHGSPRSDEELITPATPPERVMPMLAGINEAVVVCGHTHMQFDRTFGGTRVLNAGSVGMPYADRPGAYWALLGPDVELRRTEYDLRHAAERIRATGFPGADDFARENVLAVPTAQEAITVFEPDAE